MFCEICGSEYVEGISQCGDCGVELVAQSQALEGKDLPLCLVRICGSTDASMIEELLKNNGIDSVVQGEITALTIPAAGELSEVRVWVQEPDLAKAGELIDAFFDLPSEIADGLNPEDTD